MERKPVEYDNSIESYGVNSESFSVKSAPAELTEFFTEYLCLLYDSIEFIVVQRSAHRWVASFSLRPVFPLLTDCHAL